MSHNSKFCPLPWIFQDIRNDGNIRVCCHAHSSPTKGLLHKEDGSLFNASHDNLSQASNSHDLKSLRLSMLNNETNSICTRCDIEESQGIRSRRNVEVQNWKEKFTIEDAHKVTSVDGSTEISPIYYDMRFGNKCNLKCRSCSPTDSSSWYDDHVELWNQDYFKSGDKKIKLIRQGTRLIEEPKLYDWYESDGFWEQISARLQTIEHISTSGGEPLLIEQHFTLLKKCIDLKVAHKITIDYNSNITIIPEKAWGLWSHFKRVNIGASIDGVGRLNDYLRHPSKFDNTFQNLQTIDASADNIYCWIATTVQIYNAHHLPELIKWVIKNKFKKVQRFLEMPVLNCHPLHNPHFLSTKVLPMEVKKWISGLYQECNEWMETYAHEYLEGPWLEASIFQVREMLKAYEDLMYSEDLFHLFPKFITYSKGLDVIRKESFEHSIPDLWEKLKPFIEDSNGEKC